MLLVHRQKQEQQLQFQASIHQRFVKLRSMHPFWHRKRLQRWTEKDLLVLPMPSIPAVLLKSRWTVCENGTHQRVRSCIGNVWRSVSDLSLCVCVNSIDILELAYTCAMCPNSHGRGDKFWWASWSNSDRPTIHPHFQEKTLGHFCSLKKVYHWLFCHIASTYFINIFPPPACDHGTSKAAKIWRALMNCD